MNKLSISLLVFAMLLTSLSGITVAVAEEVTVDANSYWTVAYFNNGRLYNYNPDDPPVNLLTAGAYSFAVTFAGSSATVSGLQPAETEKIVIPGRVTRGGTVYEVRVGGAVVSQGNTTLKTVVISEGVKVVQDQAFRSARGVTSLTLPSTLLEVGSMAFTEMKVTGDFVVPHGIQTIKKSAFNTWSEVNSITFPSTVTSFDGTEMFINNAKMKRAVINFPLTQIAASMFSTCGVLEYVEINGEIVLKDGVLTIPETITALGNASFYRCYAIKKAVIPSSVISIGNQAFFQATGLTEIVINEGVITIGSETFSGVNNLKTLVIPSTVTSLGNRTFQNMYNLESLTIKGNVGIDLSKNVLCNGSSKLKTFIFEGTAAPTVTSEDYTHFINSNYTGITVHYNVKGLGYDETFKARFPTDTIFIPSGPPLPSVTGLSLTGSNVVGNMLSGSYVGFSANEDAHEQGSTAIWRRADNFAFTSNVVTINTEPISAGVVSEHTLTTADAGKYIQFAVIPRSNAAEDNVGDESSVTLPDQVRLAITQPRVTLTAPSAGYRVHEGTPIALSAAAVCDNTTVAKIEYYANEVKIGESSAAPFDAVWESPTPGEYEMFARAYNALQTPESGDSAKISIKVYDISESIEPVWANKWSYDFNEFTADGIYNDSNKLPGGLPGSRPPTITYNAGTVRSAHGLFGKPDTEYHLQTNAGTVGTNLPRIDFYGDNQQSVMDAPIKTIVAEMEIAFSNTNNDHYLFAYRTNYTAYNMFHFQKNGDISYPISAGTGVIQFKDENNQPLKYEANRWYRVGTIIDLENKEVSYFLNGEKLLARDMPDAERNSAVSSIAVSGIRNSNPVNEGGIYLNYLSVGQVQDSYVSATLSAPIDGSYYLTGSDVAIKGYAKDARENRTIQKVEFLVNGEHKPELDVQNAAFDFKKSNFLPGHYVLQARAVSDDGMIGYSEKIKFTVSAVTMPTMYANDMLLQRNKEIKLSGPGQNGASVTVRLNGIERTSQITGGKWSVVLPPQPASKKTTLEIVVSDGVTITYENVAIGEMLLIFGQSNMGYSLDKFSNLRGEADKHYEDIRFYRLPSGFKTAGTEQPDPNGRWTTATRVETLDFSAIGFLMAKDYYLSQNEQVPIGMLWVAVNETNLHTYAPTNSFLYDPDLSDQGSTNYKGAIAPWKEFTFGTAFYYQGEANTHLNTPYEKMLTQMIDTYREAFKDPGLNFIIVQLPAYDYPRLYASPTRSAIGVRDAQWNVSERIEGVETVVGVDTGNHDNIHPEDKKPLAERASLILQHFSNPNDTNLVWRSPSYTHHEVNDGIMTIHFKDIADGLRTKDYDKTEIDSTNKPLRGFKLADSNGVFQPVAAEIVGDTVQIDVSSVAGTPKVRYAFDDTPPVRTINGINRPDLNLVNSAKLPMAPFRTDSDKYNFKSGVPLELVNFAPIIRWIKADYLMDGSCKLTVNARDYDGYIVDLELFKDGTSLGKATQEDEDTFVYMWEGATEGTFNFHAIAADNEGTTSIMSHSSMGAGTANARRFPLQISSAPLYSISFNDLDGKVIKSFGGKNGVRAAANLADSGGMLILSAYNGNMLLKMKRSDIGDISFTADELIDATEIKAFIWDNFDRVDPLCNAKNIYK